MSIHTHEMPAIVQRLGAECHRDNPVAGGHGEDTHFFDQARIRTFEHEEPLDVGEGFDRVRDYTRLVNEAVVGGLTK